MKKLLFIIPIARCLFFTTLLLNSAATVFATDGVDGCHIIAGSQSRNYHTPFGFGSGSPTEWVSTSSGGGGYNIITTTRCIENVGPSCTVYKYGTGASPTAADILYIGTYAVMINCPIDDYIPLLAIFTLSLAVLKIRRTNLMLRLHENHPHHGSV
ncbi:MAG: hypothetical protein EOO98_00480 [Pedobacter sp.]|nr:MAG: hypothetical protein EOO98_00480 [Pedobacter sp.]